MEDRHHLTFDTYEEGKLTLEEYLGRVVFYQKRPFTRTQFRRFMFAMFEAGDSLRRILEGVISAAASRVAVRVIRSDEESMIAKTVAAFLALAEKGESNHEN